MSQNFQAGDYLIFQIESGFGLLRLLAFDENEGEIVWHLAAFNEMFLDVETADMALQNPSKLTINIPHLALTNRAFEATQVARMINFPLEPTELEAFEEWKADPNHAISDLSVRLLLGFR